MSGYVAFTSAIVNSVTAGLRIFPFINSDICNTGDEVVLTEELVVAWEVVGFAGGDEGFFSVVFD